MDVCRGLPDSIKPLTVCWIPALFLIIAIDTEVFIIGQEYMVAWYSAFQILTLVFDIPPE
jgi:hypothetical protein